MGELRQIPFAVEYDTTGDIVGMFSEDKQHVVVPQWNADGSVSLTCKCAGHWRIGASKISDEEIKATFNSHLAYFERPKIKPD